MNYTLSYDKADDDNERDPFTFRYARADSLQREYNWSDRDQRHRFNGWVLRGAAGRLLPEQPAQRVFGPAHVGELRRQPAVRPARHGGEPARDRICDDGHILQRNTIRRDNAYFSWDIRLSKPFDLGRQGTFEAILEVFNVTDSDNFRDPSSAGVYLNFDGTIRSGLGEPRQFQVGGRYLF